MILFVAKNDTIDFDNGTMIVHRDNIKAYLNEYQCHSENEFEDSMWLNYGIFVNVIN